jgi:hypothetical protein
MLKSVCAVQFAQVVFPLTAFIILPFTCQHLLSVSPLARSFIVFGSALCTSLLLLSYLLPWMCVSVLVHAKFAL